MTILAVFLAFFLLDSLAARADDPANAASPITNLAEWKDGKPTALPDLRRPKIESVLIYQPTTEWTYSHHPHIASFAGRLVAIWSNGRVGEDEPGQRVLMAASSDFQHWTEPRPLVDSVRSDDGAERVLTAGGFHQHNGTLVAYLGNYGPKKQTPHLEAITITTGDGDKWGPVLNLLGLRTAEEPTPTNGRPSPRRNTQSQGPITNAESNEIPVCPNHGPQPTASGRLILSGGIAFPYTDDRRGLADWKMTGIYPPEMTNVTDDPDSIWTVAKQAQWPVALCEGAFYQTDDGVLHMLLRATGPGNTSHLWVTESRDDGATWSKPVETQFSNSDAKFHVGRLPDGRFYWVGNPLPGNRTPLVLSLSRDGVRFDQHFILGESHYEMRRPGHWKGGEYGYPHTLVSGGYLYAICSRQKEAVEVLRVSLNDL